MARVEEQLMSGLVQIVIALLGSFVPLAVEFVPVSGTIALHCFRPR